MQWAQWSRARHQMHDVDQFQATPVILAAQYGLAEMLHELLQQEGSADAVEERTGSSRNRYPERPSQEAMLFTRPA